MRYGDVCLVSFPFTDGSSQKIRPVVVVSADKYNNRDVVVAAVTGTDLAGDDCIRIDGTNPHFAQTGLSKGSTIKCGKLFTLERSRILRRLGSLHESLQEIVRTKLADVLSIN